MPLCQFVRLTKDGLRRFLAALMVCVCASACAQDYSLGDEADEIATIQTALKQLKLYSAGITGHYGEKTATAVKKFQKKYALEDNGIVNEATRAALYEAAGITYTASSSRQLVFILVVVFFLLFHRVGQLHPPLWHAQRRGHEVRTIT